MNVLSEQPHTSLGNVHIGILTAEAAASEAGKPGLEPPDTLPTPYQVTPSCRQLAVSVYVLEALFVSQLLILLHAIPIIISKGPINHTTVFIDCYLLESLKITDLNGCFCVQDFRTFAEHPGYLDLPLSVYHLAVPPPPGNRSRHKLSLNFLPDCKI